MRSGDWTSTWALKGATCGECGSHVVDNAGACPGCGQTTGPFHTNLAVGTIRHDPDGSPRLWVSASYGPGWNRALTDEQARRIRRYGTGGGDQ